MCDGGSRWRLCKIHPAPSGRVIAADNVQGTGVYDRAGNKLGSVEDIMIDKISGRVCYAVLNFGGIPRHGHEGIPAAMGKAEL